MAIPGQTISNSITGETLTFMQTAQMTGGAFLEFLLVLKPGSTVPMKHVHTEQDEIFGVISGMVNVEVGAKKFVIKPGETILMEKGIPHRWWNNPETSSELNVRFIPAKNTEEFFEEIFALASSGKTKNNGAPTFMQAAGMCGKYGIYHPWIPVFLQKTVSRFVNLFDIRKLT